jgi:hypothetical protein
LPPPFEKTRSILAISAASTSSGSFMSSVSFEHARAKSRAW